MKHESTVVVKEEGDPADMIYVSRAMLTYILNAVTKCVGALAARRLPRFSRTACMSSHSIE